MRKLNTPKIIAGLSLLLQISLTGHASPQDELKPLIEQIKIQGEVIALSKNEGLNLKLSCDAAKAYWGLPLKCVLTFTNLTDKKIKTFPPSNNPMDGYIAIWFKLKKGGKWKEYENPCWGLEDVDYNPILVGIKEKISSSFTVYLNRLNKNREYLFLKAGIYEIVALSPEYLFLSGKAEQISEKGNRKIGSNIITVTVLPPADKLSQKLCKLIMSDPEIKAALNNDEPLDLEYKDDKKLLKRIGLILKKYSDIKGDPYLSVLKNLYDKSQPGKKETEEDWVPNLKNVPVDPDEAEAE